MLGADCSRPPDTTPLLSAWEYCEAGEYPAAFPLLREHLLRHPRDAAAHYLLGKCFSNRTPPELTRAKGEFDTARHLFDTYGSLSVLETEMDAAAFQGALHYETALVLLRTVMEAQKAGISERASLGVLKTAAEHARKGLYFSPESPEIGDLLLHLENYVARIEGGDWNQLTPPNYI